MALYTYMFEYREGFRQLKSCLVVLLQKWNLYADADHSVRIGGVYKVGEKLYFDRVSSVETNFKLTTEQSREFKGFGLINEDKRTEEERE